MDKKVIDKLIQFGLITNIGVEADKYTDIDDLIAKGIVTIPGAKAKIMELIGGDVVSDVVEHITEVLTTNEPVIDETPESAPVIDETPKSEPVIDETPETEVVISDDPADNVVEIITENVVDDITPEVVEPTKTKKSKKN